MNQLQFNAPITLKAAPGKPRRFKILAYTGGLLPVTGFQYPVIVDLSGLQAAANIPIVLNHQTTTENTVGQVVDLQNNGRNLVLAGSSLARHSKFST